MKITRAIAGNAARKMSEKQFNDSIEKIENEIKKYGEKLANKYIPKEIIEISKVHKKFFDMDNCIKVISEHSIWPIYVKTENKYPNYSSGSILISTEDMNKAKSLTEKKGRLSDEKGDLFDRITDTLISIRTTKKVDEIFPEALPFLEIENKQLPAIKIDDLRNLFK